MNEEFKEEFLLDDPEAEGIDVPADDESDDEDEEADPAADETI